MPWPDYLETVTVVDVLESGACYDGVLGWIKENGNIISGPTDTYSANEYILTAARGNGDGNGDGYGYGDGDGNGYGNGDGDGNGPE